MDSESRSYWQSKRRRRERRIAAAVYLTSFALIAISVWGLV